MKGKKKIGMSSQLPLKPLFDVSDSAKMIQPLEINSFSVSYAASDICCFLYI